MRSKTIAICGVAASLVLLLPRGAAAQARPAEVGVDGEFNIFWADGQSSAHFILPVSTARIAIPVWRGLDFEPKVGLAFSSGVSGTDRVSLVLGTVYHLVDDPTRARVYVRPFFSLEFAGTEESGSTVTAFGAGLGVKVPLGRTTTAQGRPHPTWAVRSEVGLAASDKFNGWQLYVKLGPSFFIQ